MKIAFVTEMGFQGKIPSDHPNMRTEFAWMIILDAIHYCIYDINFVKNYDNVFVIFPKGKLFLSAEGSTIQHTSNPISELLQSNVIHQLKQFNKNVYYVQEGPTWWFNDYSISDQFAFIEMLNSSDAIFAHNEIDKQFYSGWFPQKPIYVLPTLMVENTIKNLQWKPENKTIIGGNFSRWYGGIQSYRVATEFDNPIWTITSHSTRENESDINNLNHLPRVLWNDWMEQLSSFKYAVHLMPTVAAGTFSLNCSHFGIPCIGNEQVDTQRICFPKLSIDVNNVNAAIELAQKLKNDLEFYNECSTYAKNAYLQKYSVEQFKKYMNNII